MTTIPTHDQVAAAKREAAELEARLNAAEEARYEREKTARDVEALRRVDEDNDALKEAVAAAEAELARVINDPAGTLDQLWDAFSAVKVASSVYVEWAAINGGNANNRFPVANPDHGLNQYRQRFHYPRVDRWAGTTFPEMLANVLRTRTDAASHTIRDKYAAIDARIREEAENA